MTITQYLKFHLNVRDQEGNVIESGVNYSVYTAGSAALATIYADVIGTAKTNPVTAIVFAVDKGIEFFAITTTVDIVLEFNGQRVNIDAVGPGTEHNVIVNVQEYNQVVRHSLVHEFDCGIAAADPVILIPAADNPRGLIIVHGWAYITEAMVGAGEDQGIVTVSDESDNALFTLTPSDAAADAIGDYILGVQLANTATGTAVATLVAAGEYVDGVVTQICVTTPAGKYKVFMEYIRL